LSQLARTAAARRWDQGTTIAHGPSPVSNFDEYFVSAGFQVLWPMFLVVNMKSEFGCSSDRLIFRLPFCLLEVPSLAPRRYLTPTMNDQTKSVAAGTIVSVTVFALLFAAFFAIPCARCLNASYAARRSRSSLEPPVIDNPFVVVHRFPGPQIFDGLRPAYPLSLMDHAAGNRPQTMDTRRRSVQVVLPRSLSDKGRPNVEMPVVEEAEEESGTKTEAEVKPTTEAEVEPTTETN
jgi:hypothetical protein